MPMSDLLKKIAYWALVLTLVVAEIGSFFDLFNINPWCYPVYAALLILYNKFSSPLYATSPFIIVRATAATMKHIAIIFEIRFSLIGLYEENLLYSISNAA